MFHSTSAMDRAKRSFMGSRNVRHYASSFANQKLAEVLPGGDIRKTHLFDGIKLHRDWQNFQLCDVSEPELVELIDDRDGMRGTCFVGRFCPLIAVDTPGADDFGCLSSRARTAGTSQSATRSSARSFAASLTTCSPRVRRSRPAHATS
jgi:hypothetical protein